MSRTPDVGKPAKGPIEKYIQTIVTDIFETFAMPSDKWRSLSKSPPVPMTTTTEDNRQLR